VKKIILFAVIILAVTIGFTSHKETVAVDQVGVRSFLGQTSVFAAGETVIVLPLVHKFVMMTAKPVAFWMKGPGALVITGADSASVTVECKVRYQIDDPGKFIAAVGTVDSGKVLNDRLRAKVEEILQGYMAKNNLDLSKIETRMIISGETIHALNDEVLSPGVSVLAFELLNW